MFHKRIHCFVVPLVWIINVPRGFTPPTYISAFLFGLFHGCLTVRCLIFANSCRSSHIYLIWDGWSFLSWVVPTPESRCEMTSGSSKTAELREWYVQNAKIRKDPWKARHPSIHPTLEGPGWFGSRDHFKRLAPKNILAQAPVSSTLFQKLAYSW